MSLPGDALAFPAIPGALLSPDALGRPNRVIDYEHGGIALNDGTQGLQVQNWRLRLVGTEVRVSAAPYVAETVLITVPGITQCSLAFDQNMNPAVAYAAGNQAYLYWYSTALEAMTTTTLDADVRSPFLCMDDKRAPATTLNLNDVLLFYIRSNRLCYRQQRDSYTIERTLAWFDGNLLSIHKAGMNAGLRMQVEVSGLSNRIATGAVLSGWRAAAYMAGVVSITGAMPADILASDLLYAVLMHRSAVTPDIRYSGRCFCSFAGHEQRAGQGQADCGWVECQRVDVLRTRSEHVDHHHVSPRRSKLPKPFADAD